MTGFAFAEAAIESPGSAGARSNAKRCGEPINGDRHAAGRLAAERALALLDPAARLAYDGPRPIVVGADASISITHGKARALAVAARVPRLGIDLCELDDRLPALVDRYLADERALATSPWACAACLAAKEAGLKALGLGLLDGGVFDRSCPIRVASLDPPRLYDPALALAIERTPEGALAIAWRDSGSRGAAARDELSFPGCFVASRVSHG